jgi:type III secretory pathway component EscT
MNLWVKVAIWFVCFMLLLDWSFGLITQPSTIANLLGIALAIFTFCLTLKTKCFTTITFKKHKDEKSN